MFPKPRPKLIQKRATAAAKDAQYRRARQAAMARDGKRCRVPGCKQPAVDTHHVIFRSLGGRDDVGNLVSLCRVHHEDVHGHVLKLRWRDDEHPAKTVTFERVA